MSQSRPIAETVVMMLRIIASAPPHTGIRITVRPDVEVVPSETDASTTENDVTFFGTPEVADGLYQVKIREPQFDKINYEGVVVDFIHDGCVDHTKGFKGTDIADIGTEVFKWLAVTK